LVVLGIPFALTDVADATATDPANSVLALVRPAAPYGSSAIA
jgi:hypothetical protein